MDGFVNMATSNVYIRFNRLHLARWNSAINKISSILKTEKKDLPYRNAVDFSNLIVKNISTQKYSAGYAPLNTRYREWKAKYGRSGREFWALFNRLIQRVSAYKVTGGWMGGIQAGKKVGDTSWFGKGIGRASKGGGMGHMVDIAQIARWLEFGRRRQPGRPLFQPTTVEYWKEGFVKRGAESLRKIKGAWGK